MRGSQDISACHPGGDSCGKLRLLPPPAHQRGHGQGLTARRGKDKSACGWLMTLSCHHS
jgi:hypothetical protein